MKSPLTFLCAFSVLGMFAQVPGHADDKMDWVPPEAMSDGLRAEEAGQVILPVTITPTPKKTADASRFTREYVLELSRFGIHNDGTHAEETSKGLNAALQHAKTLNANRIIFPPGTYLISETDPILLDHKDTIVDLNGATLQIQTNGLPKYAIVKIINGAENLRLTNGTLRGDRDTHDYKAAPGTHEWGTALNVVSGVNLEIDHLVLTNGSGDGISIQATGNLNRQELLEMIKYSVRLKDLEQGAFSETGEKIPSTEAFRSIEPFDLSKCGGEFEVGYTAGYQGFPFIKARIYEVLFLDENGKFMERRKVPQYRKTAIPEGAKYAHFQFNQSEISEEPAHAGASKGWLVRITNFRPPRDVHFHHNIATGNRRLGMAYCGGQRWVIEDNRFENNGGTNPGYGVDFEDGAELMQDVVFRRNTFEGNAGGDLVVCAGSELLFEDNVFKKNVVTWGRPNNYTFRNNRFTGGRVIFSTRTGIAKFHNNSYSDCKLSIRFDTKAVADGIARKPGQAVSTPPLLFHNEKFENVAPIDGTYLNFKDSVFRNASFVAGKDTRLVQFEGCRFEDSSLEVEEKGPRFLFELKNNTGELSVTGAMENRRFTPALQK